MLGNVTDVSVEGTQVSTDTPSFFWNFYIFVGKTKEKMKPTTHHKIFEYLAAEQYTQARKLLKTHYKKEPQSYWLQTMIGATYYEQRKYEKALFWAEKAMTEGKNDPLVLWDYAGVLSMLGRTDEAMRIWQQLIDCGSEKVGTELCGEGIRWAKSLINDCRYRLALAHKEKGNREVAHAYFQAHLTQRRGTPSLYALREVKKEISLL